MTPAMQHYQAGRLKEAVAAAVEEVKKKPRDATARLLLCELLLFAGELDRADIQLDTLGLEEPKWALRVSLLRHLVRAEKARLQFYMEGRVPEFVGDPSPDLRLRLEASICIREGNLGGARELLDKAEAARPKLKGSIDRQEFDDFRDLDDLTASFFEVLTSTGKYYWIPMERVVQVELERPSEMYDLVWRSAKMVVRGGPDAVVYLPTLYTGSHDSSEDDRLRLGRMTDWRGGDGAPVRGLGQRIFLAGSSEQPILQIGKIEFSTPDGV